MPKTSFLNWLQEARERRRGELRHAVRLTVAAVIAYAVGETLALPQAYWAVFTAVLVSQASVGGSVKAAGDWLIGTLGGGVYAAVVSTLMTETDPVTKAAALGTALLPLAFLAAVRPTFRFAPVTGVIIILIAPLTQMSPLEAAMNRLIEICIGGAIGIVTSLFVLPARASRMLNQTAARTLESLAAILTLLPRLHQGETEEEYNALHDQALVNLDKLILAVDEAKRERASFLSGSPDPEPILRGLRRLRADIIMLGRAMATRLPEAYHARLTEDLTAALDVVRRYFVAIGEALETRSAPPPLAPVDEALRHYGAELNAVREEGLTRGLAADVVGRTFAVGFALEQLRTNLGDLASRTGERARKPKVTGV
ncbi:MAG: FUSC family protein [Proteobacteria bacterium]|nr:FUSC family protein [Pseudomonadota bacterium]